MGRRRKSWVEGKLGCDEVPWKVSVDSTGSHETKMSKDMVFYMPMLVIGYTHPMEGSIVFGEGGSFSQGNT